MSKNQSTGDKTVPIGDIAKLLGGSFGPAFRLLVSRAAMVRQWSMLLREGTDPIVRLLLEANNTALINRWLDNGTKVVFVSSYPRSGNTWMRYMLSDVLLQMHGVETSTKLPVDPDNLIALFENDCIVRRLARCPKWVFEAPMVFVKTHAALTRLEQTFSNYGSQSSARPHGAAPYRDCRALFLYRAPEDAMVSYYHLEAAYRGKEICGIDEFCQRHLGGWVTNITSHLRAADKGFPVFFVPYDQLLAKPVIVLTNMLQWLGVEQESRIAQRAVSNMRFCNLQAMEKKENDTEHPRDENALFFRRGQNGSGRQELKESTLREIQDRTASWIREANERHAQQSSALTVPAAPAPVKNGEVSEPVISPCPQ